MGSSNVGESGGSSGNSMGHMGSNPFAPYVYIYIYFNICILHLVLQHYSFANASPDDRLKGSIYTYLTEVAYTLVIELYFVRYAFSLYCKKLYMMIIGIE